MEYTKVPTKIKNQYKRDTKDLKLGESPKRSISKKNIGYWMTHSTGLKPYLWQYMVMKRFMDSILKDNPQNQIWCTARQFMGKSLTLSVIALHSVLFNTMPISSKGGYTHIGIVSRSDSQSKKMIGDIRNLIAMADRHVQKLTGGAYKGYVSNMLSKKASDANNRSELTFRNSNGTKTGVISAYPPTDAIVGETLSALLCDEAAIYDDEDFFLRSAFPTLNTTRGPVILASTPRGPQGYFYKLFDPEDAFNVEGKEFFKVWFNWKFIENPRFKQLVKNTRDMYYSTGKEKLFEQEYNARFITTSESYFDNEDIENAVDPEMTKLNGYKGKCDMGVDFGVTNSQTVITISTMDKEDNIRLLYDKVYLPDKDDNLLEDIIELRKSFNIQRIIVDDCAAGYNWIKQMEKRGLPIKRMLFKRDKLSKFTQFKAALKQGKIKYYKHEVLKNQLRVIIAKEGSMSTRITSPKNARDDLVDSFIMSCYYYLEGKRGVKLHKWRDRKDAGKISDRMKKYMKSKKRFKR